MMRRRSSRRVGWCRLLGQACIAGLRRPLVDGTPRHVQRNEGASREGGQADRAHGRHGLAAAAAVPQFGDPWRACLLAVRLEDASDGLAVPHLLEDPAGEERGDLGLLMRRRQQEVAQVADRVVLHVVHVAQRAQVVGREGIDAEIVEVDPVQVQLARPVLVGIKCRSHNAYYSEHRLRPDGGITSTVSSGAEQHLICRTLRRSAMPNSSPPSLASARWHWPRCTGVTAGPSSVWPNE